MEGNVPESIHLILTKFTDETITIFVSLWALVTCVLVIYWVHNRRKFHKLSHQIPAGVLKNYLDSIIQNSTALKSSLFRGGGLDLGEGIPSVMPVKDLPAGQFSKEELNQKNAEISSLNSRLIEKDNTIKDLEAKIVKYESGADVNAEKEEEVKILKDEVASLQEQLKSAQATSGGDPEAEQKLAAVSKERDELKERLMEYEIIEEDLANLKRLQQENEQLKKSLAAYEGGAPPAAAPEPEPAAAPEPEPEPAADSDDDFEAQMAQAIEETPPPAAEPEPEPEPVAAAADDEGAIPAGEDGEQKSAEELLSEFEKMLG